MRVVDGTCDKTCGCGLKTRTTTCVYSATGQPVPETSQDFECCQPVKVEQVACNMHCCPTWHQCDPQAAGSNCANDVGYSVGQVFKYAACTKSCGIESVPGELRCMCKNTCEASYAASVIKESVAPVANSYTRHKFEQCDATAEAGTNTNDATGGTATESTIFAETVDAAYGTVMYRRTRTADCSLPCCVAIVQKAQTCPALNCYDTDKTRPWFLSVTQTGSDQSGNPIYTCTPGNPIFSNSESCECDNTGASVVSTCTKNGVTYNNGDTITAGGPSCPYLRDTYINYNQMLEPVTGKAGSDNYYCCTEENENDLFDQWQSWSDVPCVFEDSSSDPNECGCSSNGDTCGIKTRRRRLKCSNLKVDDTTCPCVETKKCEMPKCPVQGGFQAADPPCEFNKAAALGSSKAYQTRQCCPAQDYSVASFFSNTFQYGANKQNCDWCSCTSQVSSVPSFQYCQNFDRDCEELVWTAWSGCMPAAADAVCGSGLRSRHRSCTGVADEDVERLCYDATERRTLPAADRALSMKDNSNYYESEECYAPCANTGIVFTDWSACSNPIGAGMQMRYQVNNPSMIELRECEVKDVSLDLATGTSDPVYTECNAACGVGTRIKYVHDFATGITSATEEDCSIGPACPVETEQCPIVVAPNSAADDQGNNSAADNANSSNTDNADSSNNANTGNNNSAPATTASPAAPAVTTASSSDGSSDNSVDNGNAVDNENNNDTGNTDNAGQGSNNNSPTTDPTTVSVSGNAQSSSTSAVIDNQPDSTSASYATSLSIAISILTFFYL